LDRAASARRFATGATMRGHRGRLCVAKYNISENQDKR
jgi:hypothetical protein